jgi:hypothetical protein
MSIVTRYVFMVSMDVAAEKEALFNEVYDQEHVPNLLKVPGVRGVTRLRTEPASFILGGQARELTGQGAPRYVAIYEIDSPEVLNSAAWAKAAEQGRWPTEVRPHTSNRHHIVRAVV